MTPDREQEFTFDPEQIARDFHDAYEEFAPIFNYTTRPKSAVPWKDVPVNNKRLMIATCEKATAPIFAALDAERAAREQAEQERDEARIQCTIYTAPSAYAELRGEWQNPELVARVSELEQALTRARDYCARPPGVCFDATLAGAETKEPEPR